MRRALHTKIEELTNYKKVRDLNGLVGLDTFSISPKDNMIRLDAVGFGYRDGTYVVPNFVDIIGTSCFEHTEGVKHVIFGKDVFRIDVKAFQNCTELEKLTMNEGLHEVGYNAFGGCIRLKEIILPSTVEIVGARITDEYSVGTEKIVFGKNIVECGEQWFTFRRRYIEFPSKHRHKIKILNKNTEVHWV